MLIFLKVAPEPVAVVIIEQPKSVIVQPRTSPVPTEQKAHASEVVKTQPQAVVPQEQFIEFNEWSTNICLCCTDCKTIWYVLFCSCCAMTDIASYTGKSAPCCWGWFGCFCYALLRTSLRQKRRIPGNRCRDWFVCIFLCPCMVCQMVSEIKASGHEFDGFWKFCEFCEFCDFCTWYDCNLCSDCDLCSNCDLFLDCL